MRALVQQRSSWSSGRLSLGSRKDGWPDEQVAFVERVARRLEFPVQEDTVERCDIPEQTANARSRRVGRTLTAGTPSV